MGLNGNGGDNMTGLMRALLATQEIEDATKEEIELLQALHGVDGYPFDPKKDLQFIRELKDRFSNVDIYATIIDWTVSKRYDDPLTKKSRPRSQINTWCRKRSEWNAEKNNGGNGEKQVNQNKRNPLERPVPPPIEEQEWFKELLQRERDMQP